MPALAGVSHLSFSVPDLESAVAFWRDVLGFESQNDDPAYRFLLHRDARIAVILTSHGGAVRGPFSEHNPGLDHVSLAVSDPDELRRWAAQFPGPDGQPTPVVESDAGWHLNVRGPDDFPIELFVLNDTAAVAMALRGEPVAATHA
jgi:catechol 2,3-dioxygenase-like lactoylglutathione lyase family enzyme